MIKIKNLNGECQQCGGAIEFRAETTGMTADCPHCGQPTELRLAGPPESAAPEQTKAIIYTMLALAILVGGLVVTLVVLKRAERLSDRHREALAQTNAPASFPPANPFAPSGFRASPVVLANSESGGVIYAVGKVYNLTSRQRFGVAVELELLDGHGDKVGDAKDYQALLEPNAEWQFRALVVAKNAVAAKVVAIREVL